jgi:hypothetical protein
MAPGVRSLAALLVFAVSVGLAGCGGGPQTFDAEALKKQAEAIESLAAEGALLAADVSEGDTTSPFARVHAEALGKNADSVVAALEPGRAKLAGVSRPTDLYAHNLARSVRADLAKLEQDLSSDGAARLSDRLERKSEAAKRLAESL